MNAIIVLFLYKDVPEEWIQQAKFEIPRRMICLHIDIEKGSRVIEVTKVKKKTENRERETERLEK